MFLYSCSLHKQQNVYTEEKVIHLSYKTGRMQHGGIDVKQNKAEEK